MVNNSRMFYELLELAPNVLARHYVIIPRCTRKVYDLLELALSRQNLYAA